VDFYINNVVINNVTCDVCRVAESVSQGVRNFGWSQIPAYKNTRSWIFIRFGTFN